MRYECNPLVFVLPGGAGPAFAGAAPVSGARAKRGALSGAERDNRV